MSDTKKITEIQNNIKNTNSGSMGTSFPDCGNKLFHAIQEPVLVVTPDGIIIDVNNTALTAAKKNSIRNYWKRNLYYYSRTEEITLSGEYLLTISHVKNLNGEKNTSYRKRTDKR